VYFPLISACFPTLVFLWCNIVAPEKECCTMGTIISRQRQDGTTGYTAQVRVKVKGRVVHQEAETFDRVQAAKVWIAKRETELRQPGGLERIQRASLDPILADVIERYMQETKEDPTRTKANILRRIQQHPLAQKRCSKITSADVVEFAQSLQSSPATRLNYVTFLGGVFALAKPAWGYPLDRDTIKSALIVLKRLGVVAKGGQRERRPTLAELNKLMDYFVQSERRSQTITPMTKIVPFAIFSARRQEEITLIRWDDYEKAHGDQSARILVRNMKHPGDKIGNDVLCDLPPEAVAFINSMPKVDERIFPFTTDAISAAFTRACKVLGIEDLRFHDLRHEGVSRLFEMGKQIPQAASVSGHRSWQNLKRYTHLRQTGDKYADWKWRKP
jgi:integrase